MNLMVNIFYAQIVYSLQIWINVENRLHIDPRPHVSPHFLVLDKK